MPSREQRRQHYDQYVADVRALCTIPGIRADLEKGRGRDVDECTTLHEHLAPLLREHGAWRAHYTIAALIALERPYHAYNHHTPEADPEARDDWYRRPNLGVTFAHAAHARLAGSDALKKRLRVLTRLSDDLLHRKLPGTTRLLRSRGQRPDWAVLLDDLAIRPFDRNRVTTRWLADYVTTPHPTHADNTTEPDADQEP